MNPARLRTALASGQSLAQIANKQGKTADGLVAALLAVAKSRLDRSVTVRGFGSAREQAILHRLRTFLEGLVHRTLPGLVVRIPQRPGLGFGWRSRRWGPPMSMHPSVRPPHPPSPQL